METEKEKLPKAPPKSLTASKIYFITPNLAIPAKDINDFHK